MKTNVKCKRNAGHFKFVKLNFHVWYELFRAQQPKKRKEWMNKKTIQHYLNTCVYGCMYAAYSTVCTYLVYVCTYYYFIFMYTWR